MSIRDLGPSPGGGPVAVGSRADALAAGAAKKSRALSIRGGLVRRVDEGRDEAALRGPMNTELAISDAALFLGRPIDGLNARDRKIIGTTIRALQRLLENDGVTPAHQEDQRAQLVVQGGKIMLLAAVSTKVAFGELEEEEEAAARPYRLPPLQTRQPRSFAFG